MTLHIKYHHLCPQCQALYIPYDTGVPCPSCGFQEEERFDFIPQAVESALYNLSDGSYVPGGWYVGSYADHVLRLVFMMLEQHRTGDPDADFETVARLFVDEVDWQDQVYAKDHVFDIACRVYHEIQRRPPVTPREPMDTQHANRDHRKWWKFGL